MPCFSLVRLQILPYYSALINKRLRRPHVALGKYAPVWLFDQFCKIREHSWTAKPEILTSEQSFS